MSDQLHTGKHVESSNSNETRFLTGPEAIEAARWIGEAIEMAKKATCERSQCGAVIVKDGQIIGRGFNSPAGGREDQRRCGVDKSSYSPKVTDKTCCPHAEQRAITDALSHHGDKISGASLYFARLDDKGEFKKSGEPYCTSCSRLALDTGVGSFVLSHENGICSYETGDYNNRSYNTSRGKSDGK